MFKIKFTSSYLVITRKRSRNYEKIKSLLREKLFRSDGFPILSYVPCCISIRREDSCIAKACDEDVSLFQRSSHHNSNM